MSEEDFNALSLADRCDHKSWKARLSAYAELLRIFKSADPADAATYVQYHEFLRMALSDPNQIALEAGVAAVLGFVTDSPTAARYITIYKEPFQSFLLCWLKNALRPHGLLHDLMRSTFSCSVLNWMPQTQSLY